MVFKLPKVITKEEFEKLIDYTNKQKLSRKKQYIAAMLLGFEAGMRISEIVGYSQKDIVVVPALMPDMVDDVSIKIISGKGKKDRIVPRPKRFNEQAKQLLPIKIPRRSLQDFFKKLCLKVLNKDLSFHSLRHGFCSHLANSGRPLHEVQMLAGHSRLSTTGLYLHANPKEAIAKARALFN